MIQYLFLTLLHSPKYEFSCSTLQTHENPVQQNLYAKKMRACGVYISTTEKRKPHRITLQTLPTGLHHITSHTVCTVHYIMQYFVFVVNDCIKFNNEIYTNGLVNETDH